MAKGQAQREKKKKVAQEPKKSASVKKVAPAKKKAARPGFLRHAKQRDEAEKSQLNRVSMKRLASRGGASMVASSLYPCLQGDFMNQLSRFLKEIVNNAHAHGRSMLETRDVARAAETLFDFTVAGFGKGEKKKKKKKAGETESTKTKGKAKDKTATTKAA